MSKFEQGEAGSRTRSRRRWRAALAIVVLALAATACGDDDSTTPASDGTSGDEPQTGGTLTFLSTSTGINIDPATNSDVSYESYAVFDSLIHEEEGTGELVYRLAESLESEDSVVWVLTLRADVEFSDGTALDAEAVKLNWERVAAGTATGAVSAQSIKTMEVVDERTLEVTLTEPNPRFPSTVALDLTFIGSPAAIEAEGDQFGLKPIGAGPFLQESVTEGTEVVLVRNPTYWDAPKPYLDKVIISGVADADQRYNSLVTGEADVLAVEAALHLVTKAEGQGLDVARPATSGAVGLQLNLTKAPFDDPTARLALAHAIDSQGLVDTVLSGGVPAFTSLFSEESPFYDESIEWPTYDPEAAQELIDEYAAEHGGALEVSLFLPDFFKDYGEYLQTQLSAFENLEVTVDLVDFGTFFDRVATGDFQATIDAPGFADPEPTVSTRWRTGGSNNFGGYSNPEMDTALEAGRIGTDEASRRDAYSEMQALLAADLPDVWFSPFAHLYITTPAVHGAVYANYVLLFTDVWLEQ